MWQKLSSFVIVIFNIFPIMLGTYFRVRWDTHFKGPRHFIVKSKNKDDNF